MTTPAIRGAAFLEAGTIARQILGPRAWLRFVPFHLEPAYRECEIGVRGPDGAFELRAKGPTWEIALARLRERIGEEPKEEG